MNAAQREEWVAYFRTQRDLIFEQIKSKMTDEEDIDFDKCENYKAAMNYFRTFDCKDGVNYAAAIKYAREVHDRCMHAEKLQEEKADAIIKYLGSGTTFLTLGSLLTIKQDNAFNAIFGLVAFVSLLPFTCFALLALLRAVQARRPHRSVTLPHVKFAVEMAEFHTTPSVLASEDGSLTRNEDKDRTKADALEATLWMILYPLCEAALYRNEVKGAALGAAYWNYRVGLRCLFVPLLAIPICLAILLCTVGPKRDGPAPPAAAGGRQ